ncbi:MAG: hypothetical protein GY862_00800 [Gammaproteobacteria bacterium]|nr:hypothetical protein [Gammaproteobacteria bacterium]
MTRLYIADTENHRIRKVNRQGVITTVAGKEVPGYSGDEGRAIEAASVAWILRSQPARIKMRFGGQLNLI